MARMRAKDDQELAVLDLLDRANQLVRKGDPHTAVAMLEGCIAARADAGPWHQSIRVYMRLAALYRYLDRHSDELDLLDSFRQLYPDDMQRSRVDARRLKVEAQLATRRKSSALPVKLTLRPPRMTTLEKRLRYGQMKEQPTV